MISFPREHSMAARLPTFDELLKETAESFQSLYSMMPVIGACAPGRAELQIKFSDDFYVSLPISRSGEPYWRAHRLLRWICFADGERSAIIFHISISAPARLVWSLQRMLKLKIIAFQALPMVTMILGRKNGTPNECNITTLCEGADHPKHIQFSTENLCPGMPKWV